MTSCPSCGTAYSLERDVDDRHWRRLCPCETTNRCAKCRYPASHALTTRTGALLKYVCGEHGVPDDEREEGETKSKRAEEEAPPLSSSSTRVLVPYPCTGEKSLPSSSPCVLGPPAVDFYASSEGRSVYASPPSKRHATLASARVNQIVWLQAHLLGPEDERWVTYEVMR